MRNPILLLNDILEAINSIEKFVEGIDFDEFTRNDEKSSAVIRKFEIIGEAAKGVPKHIKEKFSNVPWKEMAGFRDKLIHFYFGIKNELVWQTIKNRLPDLKITIKRIIYELEKN